MARGQKNNAKHIWTLMKNADNFGNNPKIYNFVEKELQFFRQECNFSSEELEYFNLRAKHLSNFEISLKMNISEGKVSKLAKSVKAKILRVI